MMGAKDKHLRALISPDPRFDIYLPYPEDMTNITNMFLRCQWYEQDDTVSQ